MSTPCFYLYPSPTGTLAIVNCLEGLTDIQETPPADVEDAYTGNYTPYRSFLGGSYRVRIILERFGTFGSSSVERRLRNMESHLQRGGLVGFSRDHAKTWASKTNSNVTRADTVVYNSGNAFATWSNVYYATGDEMVIEVPPAEHKREFFVSDTVGATPIDVPIPTPGAFYSYSQAAVIRWRDFYPVMWLPKDQVSKPLVTHDHRRTFTLDVTLEYNPAVVLALWGEAAPSLRGITLPDARYSLEQILGRA